MTLRPFFSGRFFPTLDGPAHLYNAQLISWLLEGKHATVNQIVQFNPDLVPNWLGHGLLFFFSQAMPPAAAEKALLILYAIALVASFYALVQTLHQRVNLLWLGVLVFVFSVPLFLGFYNFLLGIVVSMFAFRQWLLFRRNHGWNRRLIGLFLLLTLLYFTHVFVFGLLLLLIGVHWIQQTVIVARAATHEKKRVLQRSVIIGLFFLLASAPSLMMALNYFQKRPSNGVLVAKEWQVLLESIYQMSPLVCINTDQELPHTGVIFITLSVCLVIIIVAKWIPTKYQTLVAMPEKFDFGLLAAVLILLYFTLPDQVGAAGYVSMRLLLLFFFFLLAWLSAARLPLAFTLVAVTLIGYSHFQRMELYRSTNRILNDTAEEVMEHSVHLQSGSTVLPVSFSNNWLHGHLYNYIGIDKPVVVLNNYELYVDYFPLIWNYENVPNLVLGETENDNSRWVYWPSNTSNAKKRIDYVFIMGQPLTEIHLGQQKELYDMMGDYYERIHTTANCELYRLKEGASRLTSPAVRD